jgi:hypothetical protein
VRVARRVRRAGRGNPPGAILAGRPGPTQQFRGVFVIGTGAAGVHGVLDDPHGDRRPVGLTPGVQLGQVAAVGRHRDGGQLERGRGPPQDVRPGGQHVAGQGVAQKVAVGQHEHLRAERRQQVPGQPLLADRVRAKRGPNQCPGPRLRGDNPADLRERPIPGGIRGPPEVLGVCRRVGHVGGGAVHGHHPQPAAEHPGRVRGADRAGDLVEQHMQRVGAQPGPRPRQRGDVRWPPPPPVTGLDPAVRVEHPAEQLLAAAAVIQRVHQLDHDPPVAAVRAPEQPQREHEIDDQPSGQQPATQLPGVGGGHYPVHQLGRERPGQRANRYPVGQPPLR